MSRAANITLLLAATAGLFFASFSTFDFVQHLDRQVHDIHCSFVPGLAAADHDGESGCQVTMMSPYSSMLRTAVWGGIPISLPAMAVFAFLLYRGVDLLGRRPGERKGATNIVLFTATVTLLASLVMGSIALFTLNAACKLCIGIYVSSAIAFLSAVVLRVGAGRSDAEARAAAAALGERMALEKPATVWLHGLAQLGIFVVLPMVVYVGLMPDYSKYIGTCGRLDKPEDQYGVMVDMDGSGKGIAAIEVFDPLCPACRAFEQRLAASGLGRRLDRRAVMFPLDDTCNWMVSSAMHPGACAISEAVLCAEDTDAITTDTVIEWAFEHQEDIRAAALKDPEAAAKMAKDRFPGLAACIGSAKAKSKLNKSLRWAVANQIPVLTPQLYLDGYKMCDEDTDLGMDYALSRMIERHQRGDLGKER